MTDEKRDEFRSFAKALLAAYKSYKMGISLAHAYKKYTADVEPGDYWFALAEVVERDVAKSFEIQTLPSPPKGRPH